MIALRSVVRVCGTERSLNKAILLGKTGNHPSLLDGPLLVQKITKRNSGHNNMEITPSNYGWKYFKNALHFWFLVGAIPTTVVATIIGIRANPELTEIPEGYEPRHWEYFKHPVSRWLAKNFYLPMELEHEQKMHSLEQISESRIMKKVKRDINQAMQFYSDHRSYFFRPYFADYFRIGRDDAMLNMPAVNTNENIFYEAAYDKSRSPILGEPEGYKPID